MSNGDWIKHAAIGLIAIALTFIWAAFYVGSEIGEARGESNKHTAEYERHAEEKIRTTCLSGQGGDIAECVSKIIKATNEDQRAQGDLVAQTEMARWAFLMLVATVGVAVITGAGVYYVWQTLIVTRDMGRAQARAYVEVSDVKFYWGNLQGTRPVFKIFLKNHGTTPAKWLQIRQTFKTIRHADKDQTPSRFNDLELPAKFGDIWNGINPRQQGMQTEGPIIQHQRQVQPCWRGAPTARGIPPNNTHGVMVYGLWGS